MSDQATSTVQRSPRDRRRQLEALLRKKAQKSRSFPLSFAQQRLWLLEQLDPGNPVYNIPLAIRLTGALNIDALNRTLNDVVARHESLRTRIAVTNDEPMQLVDAARQQELTVVNLEHVDPSQRDAEAITRATEEARKPFRLEQGPLFRALLLRFSPIDHVLVVVMHHIISDDWSMGVLFREVALLYQAHAADRPSPLKRLTIQYADYAVWQRQRLQGETLERELDYWRRRLEGVTPLELPTDRSRLLLDQQVGATVESFLPHTLTQQLKDVGRREGATLYMTLLTAFQVLLYRYSGQEDIAVGSPIAGRLRSETEGLVGFFVNTLVMRANLAGDPSFRDLLQQVRQSSLEAFGHQEVPFERLVETLNPQRDISRHPLFQVMFTLQNAPWPDVTLPGVSLSVIPLDTGTSKFDLSFTAREERGGLSLLVEYNANLFRRDTIQRMLKHFENLLAAIVANPNQHVSELELMDEAERQTLLVDQSATRRDYPDDALLHHLVEAQARRTSDAVAVVFEDQQITYRQLDERANRLAQRLLALGVGPDTMVGIFCERSLEMVVGIFGVLKAGGAYVPLDPAYPIDRLEFMLADGPIPLLLTQRQLAESLSRYTGQVLVLGDEEDAECGIADLESSVTADHAAYVLYTSGSTGRPKGVVITHRAICNHMFWMADDLPLGPHDAVLQKTSASFDASVWEFFAPLMAGARLVMAQPYGHLDPGYLVRAIQQHQITILQLVPTLLQVLVAEPSFAQCTSLRRILVGGEALPAELVRRTTDLLGAEVCNLYGPTEATIDATFFKWDGRTDGTLAPIGRPIANVEAYVLSAQRTLMPMGLPGELYLGGAGLARGYLNRPELTAERFVPHPFRREPESRLYRTGDLVRWLPDGNLEFLGRLDHQVKIRGNRIELGEIQAALADHPEVVEAVVTTFDNDAGGKELAAYIVQKNVAPHADQLREFLQKSLPDYMIPTAFVPLEAIPLSASGKVDYKSLPRPTYQRASQSPYTPPRSPDEELLVEIWQDVLHVDQVGVHDNFFALGGHSLLATQVVSRIARQLNVDVPLRDMFQTPTIAELAQRVVALRSHGEQSRWDPIPMASRDGELLPSLTQEALWFLDQLERDQPTYTVYPALRMKGTLDTAVLERALNEIVRRHESLRTRFPEVDGRPVQVIDPPEPRPLALVDLSDLSDSQRDAAVQDWILKQTRQPIDLQNGPLIRVTLLRLAENEHVLVAAAHHIIYDGWSLGTMTRELAAIYSAYRMGRPSPLPELPIQYADFAIWQRQYLQGEALERLQSYWAKQLAGLPPLELPTDYPRPAIRTARGETLPCNLTPELSAGVKDFCRREGVTPFMTLL
ncbi:MAG: amino acid adenylation domain-containing protein, partial [Planctomycetaceae bacterium]